MSVCFTGRAAVRAEDAFALRIAAHQRPGGLMLNSEWHIRWADVAASEEGRELAPQQRSE